MNFITRTNSIITGGNNLELLYELESFPVFIGCTSKPFEDDVFANMTWMICKDSGMIQLQSLLPLDLVYSEFHSEAIGSIWKMHHEEFCKFINKYSLGNILEIGGSNGLLAQKYQSNFRSNSFWTIIEPNPSYKGNDSIKVIQDFFDEEVIISDVDTIVHSHVLEHLYDPNILLKHIFSSLPKSGKHIFSIPNLRLYLEQKFSNAINFEHTYFLTEYFTDYLLNISGFEIIEKYYFGEHSIFYSTEKKLEMGKPTIKNCYAENRQLYLNMIEFYDSEVKKINDRITSFDGEVFLFGGHIFSQFLLHRGLNNNRIAGIIDNSTLKHDKRLYGTHLIVHSPMILKDKSNVAVIVKAGQYQAEVLDQLFRINDKIKIWE
jgi:hypothetical protein